MSTNCHFGDAACSDLLVRLRAAHTLAQQGRLQRLIRYSHRTLRPFLLRHCRITEHAIAHTFFGREMHVVLPDPVSSRIWRYGFFEPDVSYFLLSLLKPADTFIDVGGHFGFFSMLGRELVAETGTVVTFEPMPCTREILAENLQRHARSATQHIVAAAAGDQVGTLQFRDFGIVGSAFATSGPSRDRRFKTWNEVEVQVVPVDQIVRRLGLISCKLIKIDAENAEMQVIKGASETIERLRPHIIIETGDDPEAGTSTRKVLDFLTERNYQPCEFSDWALRRHTPKAHYEYQNLLLVPKECAG